MPVRSSRLKRLKRKDNMAVPIDVEGDLEDEFFLVF